MKDLTRDLQLDPAIVKQLSDASRRRSASS